MKASNKTHIYIVRHGESEQNARYKKDQSFGHDLWGKLESPLTTKGQVQSKKTAKLLRKVKFDAAYSSNLLRTLHTAKIILEGRKGVKLVKVPKIHEIQLGKKFFALSPQRREKIRLVARKLPHDKMMRYRYADDGETPLEGVTRLDSFLSKVMKRHTGRSVLVTSHGNLMRKYLMHLGWTTSEELPDGAIENAGYYVLETDGTTLRVKKTYKVKKKRKDNVSH
jgi:broad specificity phosphatase PhoE